MSRHHIRGTLPPAELPPVEGLAEYVKLLETHDWHYEFSDDARVWRAGYTQWERIRALQLKVDPTGEIFRQHGKRP